MKTVVWIVVGLVIAGLAWVPINLTDPGDIPFIPAILAFVGSFVGGLIVLVARAMAAPRLSTDLARGPAEGVLPSRAFVGLALVVR
jgi:apolipoprotein N-acyltransferase